MDSVFQLKKPRRQLSFCSAKKVGWVCINPLQATWFLVGHTIVLMAGCFLFSCRTGPMLAREVIADPMMRFEKACLANPPAFCQVKETLQPTDTVVLGSRAATRPGSQIERQLASTSLLVSAEIVAGLGLEAGYEYRYERERIWKIDGFFGERILTRNNHGPMAAILYDDGTSILRAGYRYQTAFDRTIHQPQIGAKTLVLSTDTLVELDYMRTIYNIAVGSADLPASEPISATATHDRFYAAIEQGFSPGINLRLDLLGLLNNGYLQSPYRLVTLFQPQYQTGSTNTAPITQPEKHPETRARWGALLRARFAIPTWSSAFELGLGHGSGTWRVEHSQVQIAFLTRIAQMFTLGVAAGAYHQTRAIFYQDDYGAQFGKFWSADPQLSSFVAWWIKPSWEIVWLPEGKRIWGMFRYLSLKIGAGVVNTDYNFEGLDSNNGFTRYDGLARNNRFGCEGGILIEGWLEMIGAF